MTKSNRNGGRPTISPELRTERRTVTIRRVDLAYLRTIDDNLSVAIRKVVAAQTALTVTHETIVESYGDSYTLNAGRDSQGKHRIIQVKPAARPARPKAATKEQTR